MKRRDRTEYQRTYRINNRERLRAMHRKRYAENSDEYKAAARQRRLAKPEVVAAEKHAWRTANATRLRAEAKIRYLGQREQRVIDNRRRRGLPEPTRPRPTGCECCGRPPGKRALALDHCHRTGIFRGWLCGSCNTGLGSMGDTIAGLKQGIDYLLRTEET